MNDNKQTLNFIPRNIEKFPNISENEFIPMKYIDLSGELYNLDNYLINKKGEIKNITTNRIRGNRSTNRPYVYITISFNNKDKSFALHRLLASTFLLNPDIKIYTVVNHIDHDPKNNSLSNLEWVTFKENSSSNRRSKKSEDKLFQYIALDDNRNEVFKITRRDSKGFDVDCNIPLAIKEDRKYKGYYWKKDDRRNLFIPGYSGNLNDYEWYKHWKYPGLYVCKEGFIKNKVSILGTLFPSGYVEFSVSKTDENGNIYRYHTGVHRIIMEFLIKRELTDKEVVDHINTIKHDNRFENLRLCNNQAENLQNINTIVKRAKPVILADLYSDFLDSGTVKYLEEVTGVNSISLIYNNINSRKYIAFYKESREDLFRKMEAVIYVFSEDKSKVLNAFVSIRDAAKILKIRRNIISNCINTGNFIKSNNNIMYIMKGLEAVKLISSLGHGTAYNIN